MTDNELALAALFDHLDACRDCRQAMASTVVASRAQTEPTWGEWFNAACQEGKQRLASAVSAKEGQSA